MRKKLVILAGVALSSCQVYPTPRLSAHDWYPPECCHKYDCAPVTKIEVVPTQKLAAAGMVFAPSLKLPSQTLITTPHGTVVVPENFGRAKGEEWRRRNSPDGQTHACIQAGGGYTPPKLTCLFDPSGI